MKRSILKKAERKQLSDELQDRLGAVGVLSKKYSIGDHHPGYLLQGKHGTLRASFDLDDDSPHCLSLFCQWDNLELIPDDSEPGQDNGKRNLHIAADNCNRNCNECGYDMLSFVLWNFIDHLRQLGVEISPAPTYW